MPTAIPPTTAVIAAALSTVFPRMKLSFACTSPRRIGTCSSRQQHANSTIPIPLTHLELRALAVRITLTSFNYFRGFGPYSPTVPTCSRMSDEPTSLATDPY